MDNRFSKKIDPLTPQPIAATSYTDARGGGRESGHRYFVAAVDVLGQVGVPSSPVWSYREWARFYTPFGAGAGTWHQ